MLQHSYRLIFGKFKSNQVGQDHPFVVPGNLCVKLDLMDERRFPNGMAYLRLWHAGQALQRAVLSCGVV